jgi:hypothetical protein
MAKIETYFHTKGVDWHREIASDAMIAKAQAFQATRDRIQKSEVGKRRDEAMTPETWIGPLAEEVFDRWLEARGIDREWDHEPGRYDEVEFYIAPHGIDVKCMNQSADCEPGLDYACNVKAYQVHNPKVTAYVFSRFIVPTHEVIQFGMISKKDFLEADELQEQKKGDIIKIGGGREMTVSEDMFWVPISILTPTEIFLAGQKCLECNHWNGYMPGQLCGLCWMARRKKEATG